MRKCMTCGTSMKTKREHYRYDECGLQVVLIGVEVSRCPECGEHEVAIPRIEELHRKIANVLILRAERLGPPEMKFLRKYLGLSSVDFAAHIGTTPETISRWENGAVPMNIAADKLLRMMVATQAPINDYSVDVLKTVATEDPQPARIRARSDRQRRWQAESVGA